MTSAFAPQPEFLRLTRLHAFYGESHILHGIDLSVAKGECVTLLGRNGAGRTTTLKSILGLVGRRSGSMTAQAMRACGQADGGRGARLAAARPARPWSAPAGPTPGATRWRRMVDLMSSASARRPSTATSPGAARCGISTAGRCRVR